MKGADHALFSGMGPPGEVALSTGPAPTPYLVYDGHGLLIVGHCDLSALQGAFEGQDVHPVRTQGGQGIMILFVCDFRSASHGPHLELHATALASPVADASIPDHPAAALTALATRQDWGVLSLRLWNDTGPVVAYNTEYLGLQADHCEGQIAIGNGRMAFSFAGAGGQPLLTGDVRLNQRSDAGLMGQVLRHLGWRGLWDAVRRKPARAHVINRKSGPIPRNGRALTLTAPDKMIVTAFQNGADRLTLQEQGLSEYAFEPLILEHLWPFRFIYHHPDAA